MSGLELETTAKANFSASIFKFNFLLSIILSKYLRNIYNNIIALGGFKYTHRKEPVWQRKHHQKLH
nr:MAG TPA: hypothetical protein [Caudoviricetes sp.]